MCQEREQSGGTGDTRNFREGQALGKAGKASHLVEKEGPHAGHTATVVYHSRDVTGKDGGGEMQSPSSNPPIAPGPRVSRAENGVLATPSGEQVLQDWLSVTAPIFSHIFPCTLQVRNLNPMT